MPKPVNKLVLISCSAEKVDAPVTSPRLNPPLYHPAELYTSDLFRKRLEYAKRNNYSWAVLSAKYGVWWPTQRHVHYDMSLNECSKTYRHLWALEAAKEVFQKLPAIGNPVVEIHAGKLYYESLAQHLSVMGVQVELPCKGLGIGHTLALYTTGPYSANVTLKS